MMNMDINFPLLAGHNFPTQCEHPGHIFRQQNKRRVAKSGKSGKGTQWKCFHNKYNKCSSIGKRNPSGYIDSEVLFILFGSRKEVKKVSYFVPSDGDSGHAPPSHNRLCVCLPCLPACLPAPASASTSTSSRRAARSERASIEKGNLSFAL